MINFNFKEWLVGEGYSTGGKIGLYPSLADSVGQYPPLYATARIPDVITYLDIVYKGKSPPGEDGIIKPTSRDSFTHSRAEHRRKHKVWDHPDSLGKVEISS